MTSVQHSHRHFIGLMSGTSLDGLDLCAVQFASAEQSANYNYSITASDSILYPTAWRERLSSATQISGSELVALHGAYGTWLGERVREFAEAHRIPDPIIGSHGHTLFHDPSRQYSFQLGSGAHIAAASQMITICDFRSTNCALGGQGAPLVPIGDKLLFGSFDISLNLGGIANFSYSSNQGSLIAGDLIPFNLILNHLANQLGLEYDVGGARAQSGQVNTDLLQELERYTYLALPFPKSLHKDDCLEWYMQLFESLPNANAISIPDQLATYVHFAVAQIGTAVTQALQHLVPRNLIARVLITGGGAHNSYFIAQLRALYPAIDWHLPVKELIDQKEALIFAFLAFLRYSELPNVLASYTGANFDTSSGAIYLPPFSHLSTH